MYKVIIVSGPTASGKSSYAIELAQQIDGEIISCDSMQIYRGLDIGTAKVTVTEMAGIAHHLLDIKYPDEPFSVAEFQKLARVAIEEITARGKLPILVGGTGLYIQATVLDYVFTERAPLDFSRYEQFSNDELFIALSKLDEATAKSIERNNRRRLMYAVAQIEQTGIKKSEMEAAQEHLPIYDIFPIALMPERSVLYERINARVETMLADGLLAEVAFFRQKYQLTSQIAQAIGYKEPLDYLQNKEMTVDTLLMQTQQDTRKFAKRQRTWIRNQKINYYYLDDTNQSEVEAKLATFLSEKRS